LPAIFAAVNILLMLCECNCTRFPSRKHKMIAWSDSVHAIGKVTVVDGDILGGRFDVRQLGAIARCFAHSANREVALVHTYGDITGFRIGEQGAVAGFPTRSCRPARYLRTLTPAQIAILARSQGSLPVSSA